jgi:CelD/BcsL family acetyltransferase involved in cellulose biosynthesis
LTSDIRDFMTWPRGQRERSPSQSFAFQHADILELKCETIAVPAGIEPFFVAILDREDHPLALLPLSIETHHEMRFLTFLSGYLSDYNAPILYPAVRNWHNNEASLVWRSLLAVLPPFDIAIFDKQPDRVGELRNPLVHLGAMPFPSSGHATTLLGTWDDFAATRIPHYKDSQRQRRRLGELGQIKFEIARTIPQRDTFMAALIRQKTRRLLEMSVSTTKFNDAGNRNFLLEATRRFFLSGPVHLSALKLDDTIIAAHWGYSTASRFYYLVPSYESGTWRRYSPGRLLLEHLLQWSFSEGIRVFDFGIGDEKYKGYYEDTLMPLHVIMLPVTEKGRFWAKSFLGDDPSGRSANWWGWRSHKPEASG